MKKDERYILKLNEHKNMTIRIIDPPKTIDPRFKVVEHLIYFEYEETNEMGVVSEDMFLQFIRTEYLKKIEQ